MVTSTGMLGPGRVFIPETVIPDDEPEIEDG
jgi:hypothetical protein